MIFVTGGTGLLGSHLLFELTKNGEKVRALKRKSSNPEIVSKVFRYYTDHPDEFLSRIDWIEGDITNPAEVLIALKGITRVYHTAGIVSFDPADKKRILDNNIQGAANIVNACLETGIEKLCFVSSAAAIGQGEDGEMLTEEIYWTKMGKESIYAISKYQAEMEVWRGINEGLNAVIVNPSIIIGPGDWQRSSLRLFHEVYKGLRFYTEGITGYVDVRDVVKAMIFLMNSELSAERYIISAANYSYKDILSMIAESMGKRPPAIRATPFMIKIACLFDWTWSLLTAGRRKITRDILIASKNRIRFSNDKIRNAAGMEFIPIDKSIRHTSELFLKDCRADH
jgi:nucleoside-diphosphate-sugar epimerase